MKVRLNKYIAQCGICSRRKAEALVKKGQILVNETLELNPFVEIDTSKDRVTYKGRRIVMKDRYVYILLNKPKNTIATVSDESGRKTVLDLIGPEVKARIYPVGRLDRDTTGLLILTNDGDLTQRLTHPKYEVPKEYHAKLNRPLSTEDMIKLQSGLHLEDGFIKPDGANFILGQAQNSVAVNLHSGRNRIVRRMFEALGYEVRHLDRVRMAGLTKKNLARGRYRFLSKQEVINLKYLKG